MNPVLASDAATFPTEAPRVRRIAERIAEAPDRTSTVEEPLIEIDERVLRPEPPRGGRASRVTRSPGRSRALSCLTAR